MDRAHSLAERVEPVAEGPRCDPPDTRPLSHEVFARAVELPEAVFPRPSVASSCRPRVCANGTPKPSLRGAPGLLALRPERLVPPAVPARGGLQSGSYPLYRRPRWPMQSVPVRKTSALLLPDPARVVARRFAPGDGTRLDGKTKVDRIIMRVLALPEEEVHEALEVLQARFSSRHRDLRAEFERNFAGVVSHIENPDGLTAERLLLIGAYFTHEYSIEGAALSNPSIVQAPDQSDLAEGATRFVLSLRAIGEGHISSIEFRSGIVDAEGEIELDPCSRFVRTAHKQSPIYDKEVFRNKLVELRAHGDSAANVLGQLSEHFTLQELELAIGRAEAEHEGDVDVTRMTRTLHWLASSNYESTFRADSPISERVLFPAGPTESAGMEDARFVRFTRQNGTITYFATYTAYDGYQILPQLIETEDFLRFRIATLNGQCARNKGIALFPRKVDGRYMALGRLDGENNSLMRADNVRFWHDSELLQTPQLPWEFVQIGNCGSPIETEAGWLVLTHGVGAMRQYSLGAILLDLDDPSRVIGHLAEPLLEPAQDEREGYVPNVVYSCGSMIAGAHLVLPYGFSDVGMRIATVRVDDLLGRLTATN